MKALVLSLILSMSFLVLGCANDLESFDALGLDSASGGSGSSNGSDEPSSSEGVSGCDEAVYLPNSQKQIVIEAEDHDEVGGYRFENNVSGFHGDGFMVYQNSDRPVSGSHSFDGESELTFKYYIAEDGDYTFAWRATRYDGGMNYTVFNAHDDVNCPKSTGTNCTHADLNNDAFLGTTGRSPAKMFLGLGKDKDKWKMGGTFDINHNKSAPKLSLKEGIHTLTVRGRSNLFAIDRIFIYADQKPQQSLISSEKGCP
ncbi:MAG: hypothetical protein AAF202_07930 [Pseudomonadota bacterium]